MRRRWRRRRRRRQRRGRELKGSLTRRHKGTKGECRVRPMTDETLKPKRKRRRWVIAGVLLFVVGLASWWWHWPRVDPRFVGTWRLTIHAMYAEGKDLEYVVVHGADRSASYVEPGSERHMLPTKWSVDGTTYRAGSPTSIKRLNDAIHRVERMLKASVPGIRYGSNEWRIKSVSDREIEMTTEVGQQAIFTRLIE
jgi:hypothetical protein